MGCHRRGWNSFAAIAFTGSLLACSSTSVEGGGSPDVPPKGETLYVSISGADEVIAIDAHTRSVTAHIPVGKGPAILLATPDQKKLYTANWSDNTVSSIALADRQVTSIALPARPYVIANAPDGQHLYAGLSNNAIAIIDTATDQVDRMQALDTLPASIIVSPDSQTLYVASLSPLFITAGILRALAADSGDVVHANIPVGAAPAWIAITPNGDTVYTLNFLSDDISVVDTDSWRVTSTIDNEADSQGIIGNVSPDGSTLFVTNYGTGDFVAIDTAENRVRQTVALTGRPVGVAISADSRRVVVSDFGPDSLSMPASSGVNFLISGQFMASGDGRVSEFDATTGKPLGPSIEVGPGPTSVVIIDAP